MNKKLFLDGLKCGIPIGLGYFSVSIAYGMSAVLNGLSVWQTILISLSNLTSAGQFAGTTLLCEHAPYLELLLTMLIINARYLLMALSLSQKLDEKVSFPERLLIAFGITDEIFACEIGQKGKLKASFIFGLILISVIGWTSGTALGALASSVLPAAISGNLSIALYAMFIAIIVPASRKKASVFYAVLLSIAASLLFTYVPGLNLISSGYVIILITVFVSALMAWKFPLSQEELDE